MAKRRRGCGEGSITERQDGTWMFALRLGKNQPRKYIYAKSHAELLRKVADERAKGGGTIKPTVTYTVGEWCEAYLENTKRPNLAASTYAVYEVAWRLHAKPLVGEMRLQRFSPDDVVNVYAALRKKAEKHEKHLGGRMIQVVAKIMRGAFDAAILHEKYHRPNPWRAVPVPRHDYKEPRVLTVDESARFVLAAKNDRYEALWLLSLLGGLRLGECLGLRWSRVNLETGTIEVRQQLTDVGGERRLGPLKTKSSIRDLQIGPVVLAALKRRKEMAERERHGSPFCFTDESGSFVDRTYIRRRHFDKVAKAIGVEGSHPHDLRHTMASHAIQEGVSPVVVAAILGHGTPRMTFERYGHLLPGAQAEATLAIEARLANTPPSPMVVQKVVNGVHNATRYNGHKTKTPYAI